MRNILLIGLFAIFLCGCKTTQPVTNTAYFNDSDRIYSDDIKTGVCSNVEFACVVMSKGKLRDITGISVLDGPRIFTIKYE